MRMVLAIATSDVRYFTAALRSLPRSVCDTQWREGARGRERKYEVNSIITIRRNKPTAFVGHLKVLYDVAQLSSTHFSVSPSCLSALSKAGGVPVKLRPYLTCKSSKGTLRCRGFQCRLLAEDFATAAPC